MVLYSNVNILQNKTEDLGGPICPTLKPELGNNHFFQCFGLYSGCAPAIPATFHHKQFEAESFIKLKTHFIEGRNLLIIPFTTINTKLYNSNNMNTNKCSTHEQQQKS